ncbi:MAG: hypothetical protein JSW62_01785 [Thermoplasmatales archaeon]|nr:MAG: hypothetical protein JSW62_01785 [Thermoplasmatales archaeon]
MDEITLFLNILIAGFSLLLFIVSIAAYYRLRATKLLLASVAFLAFTVKGLLLITEILSQDRLVLVIDLIVLILLYFSIIKK